MTLQSTNKLSYYTLLNKSTIFHGDFLHRYKSGNIYLLSCSNCKKFQVNHRVICITL